MTVTVMNTGAPTYILTNDVMTTFDQSMHVITLQPIFRFYIILVYIIYIQNTDTQCLFFET